ncbi:MAG: hypothetical protein L0271_10855 [Gemmatimonadetes bacterium]|nr:hypothetical protein [Gemmatimonadota bacterium]
MTRALLPAGSALLLAACADHPTAPPAGSFHAAPAAAVNAAQHTSAMVRTHPSLGPAVPIPGAIATLVSNVNGVSVRLQTGNLDPGNAYTVWWVKIDAPENCATIPCGGADVLGNSAIVSSNVAYAAGHVAGGGGMATFGAHFSTGEIPGGWFDNEFVNPMGAEIHLVVMDHGPAVPGLVSNQISTLRGGCSDESVNTPPISGFPAVAKADGIPGPNTCRLVQLAILLQD